MFHFICAGLPNLAQMKWNISWTKMRGNSARLQSNAIRRSRTNVPACTTPRRPPRARALGRRIGPPEIGGRRRRATRTWSRREASSNTKRRKTGTLQEYKNLKIGKRVAEHFVATPHQDVMWRQLIDHPEAWPESSGTGMFTFAMVTGVKNGWLDAKTYGPAARPDWLALIGAIDQHADVT